MWPDARPPAAFFGYFLLYNAAILTILSYRYREPRGNCHLTDHSLFKEDSPRRQSTPPLPQRPRPTGGGDRISSAHCRIIAPFRKKGATPARSGPSGLGGGPQAPPVVAPVVARECAQSDSILRRRSLPPLHPLPPRPPA